MVETEPWWRLRLQGWNRQPLNGLRRFTASTCRRKHSTCNVLRPGIKLSCHEQQSVLAVALFTCPQRVCVRCSLQQVSETSLATTQKG